MFLNIEAERSRNRMTKTELSNKLGISLNTYNAYINGRAIPSGILAEMADMFDCSIDYLLGRTQNR